MSYIDDVALEIYRRVEPTRQPSDEEKRLFLIYAVLALVVGEQVTRENVHDAWSAWKASKEPDHRSLRPYAELSIRTQEEDEPFVQAIRSVARKMRRTA